MPRTGLNPSEIKEKAIEAAITQMRRHGFEKVRLVDIAKEVGVSHVALYSHFQDKTALLDLISERWLNEVDKAQDLLCAKEKDPLEKIQEWCLRLHQAKRTRVSQDPELYKAFDSASEKMKPFIVTHLENMNRQLLTLVKEAMAAKKIRKDSPEKVVSFLLESVVGFIHPKLVADHLKEKREPILKRNLEILFKGLS